MTSMSLRLVSLLVAVAVHAFGAAPESSGINGRIHDAEGAVLKSHVLFHPDPAGDDQFGSGPRHETSIETDDAGAFDVQLQPGFYDVCVMASVFTPQCRKVLVPKGQSIRLDLRLKVDPLVIKYIGDRVGIR